MGKEDESAAGRRCARKNKVTFPFAKVACSAQPVPEGFHGPGIGQGQRLGPLQGKLPALPQDPVHYNETPAREFFILARLVVAAEVPAERRIILSPIIHRHGPIITKVHRHCERGKKPPGQHECPSPPAVHPALLPAAQTLTTGNAANPFVAPDKDPRLPPSLSENDGMAPERQNPGPSCIINAWVFT